ncbi:YcaO-like family protein [Bacillus spongiae]|uniref:YcaO-like family protein n=1 Tax=Bacillus spongiae TaxID=2683610 RepID=A0ABU8HI88_9BACI
MDIEFQNQSNSSSSLLSHVVLKRPLFLNGIKTCKVSSNLHVGTSGQSVGYSINKVVKASLGEHLERLSLFKSKLKPDDERAMYFDAFNILSGETIQVPTSDILLEYNLPFFKHYKNMDSLYSDTCGVAAHINSRDAMLSGFLEFVERQSLIHTWLTERIGTSVRLDTIKDEHLHKTIHHLKRFVNEIRLFNISISKHVYVILTLGFHDKYFSVGVSADPNLDKAINGSLNEFAMILEGSILAEKESMEEQPFHDSQLYSEIFYNLSVEDFRNKFKFLLQSPPMDREVESKEYTFNQLIHNVSEELKIPIYCTFIPSFIESGPEKIVKVFSPDGYPHMNTELFDPEDFKISNSLPYNGFPNKGVHIPFP